MSCARRGRGASSSPVRTWVVSAAAGPRIASPKFDAGLVPPTYAVEGSRTTSADAFCTSGSAGKSCYIRMAALIAIMAQVSSFTCFLKVLRHRVPCNTSGHGAPNLRRGGRRRRRRWARTCRRTGWSCRWWTACIRAWELPTTLPRAAPPFLRCAARASTAESAPPTLDRRAPILFIVTMGCSPGLQLLCDVNDTRAVSRLDHSDINSCCPCKKEIRVKHDIKAEQCHL